MGSVMLKRFIVIAAVCTGFVLPAQSQVTNRIFMVGNSVTDGVNYDGFQAFVLSSGNGVTWARNIILGAPLAMLWGTPGGFTSAPYGSHEVALVNYTWDCVTLQPFDRGISGSDGDSLMFANFMNEAKTASPQVQFYEYQRYPRTPFSGNSPATDPSCTPTVWNQLWLGTYSGGGQVNERKSWFDSLLLRTRMINLGMKPVLMIPVGEVFYALNQKMAAGRVPGFSSIWGVYSDGIHMNGTGSFIITNTFYATMYKQDPRGIPVPANFGSIADAVRDTIQQTVYDIVFNHPYSGTTVADLVPVSGVTVSPATLPLGVLQSGQVTAAVTPSTAANKRVTWISDNTGAATVDAAGVVSAVGAGVANIIARTNNGGFKDTCVVTVSGSLPGTNTSGSLAVWNYSNTGGKDSLKATTVMNGIDSIRPNCRVWVGQGLSFDANSTSRLASSSQTAVTLTQAIAGNEYIAFTVGPQAGKLLTIDTLKVSALSQNRTRRFTLLSSVNGFSEQAVIDTFRATSWDSYHIVPVKGHINLTGSVEFRLYINSLDTVNGYEAVGIGTNSAGPNIALVGSVLSLTDNQNPGSPSNLTAPFSQIRDTTVYLAWSAATDNLAVFGYNVYNGSTKINTTPVKVTNFTAGNLTSGVQYSLTVKAVDYAGNESSTGASVSFRANRTPTAVFSATPSSGNGPLQVTFNPTGSSDPDSGDYILGYKWDFGDGSALDYSNGPVHTYTRSGTFTVTLTVVDSRDKYSPAVTHTVTVGAVGAGGVAGKVPAAVRMEQIRVYDLAGRLVYKGMAPDGALNLNAAGMGKGVFTTIRVGENAVKHSQVTVRP